MGSIGEIPDRGVRVIADGTAEDVRASCPAALIHNSPCLTNQQASAVPKIATKSWLCSYPECLIGLPRRECWGLTYRSRQLNNYKDSRSVGPNVGRIPGY